MTRALLLWAAIALPLSAAQAYDQCRPIVTDDYAGSECWKFWCGSEEYAIRHDDKNATAFREIIRNRAASGSMVNLGLIGDIAPALQSIYAPMTWCFSGDGVSIRQYEHILQVY